MSAALDAPLSQVELNRALAARISVFCLWLGAFLSGFVLAEPAPYELYMAVLIGVWALLGLRFSQSVAVLLAMLLVFNIGGLISMTQMDDWTGAPLYVAVSFFLAATSVFIAAVVEADQTRLKVLFEGWLAAAAITAFLGVIGYFGIGGETFVRFDRAKGAFEDPNVFAPFLTLPALYCLYQVLTRPISRSMVMIPLLLVLTLGVFLSFSRAGWGLYALSILLLVGYLLLANPTGRFRVRILILAVVALMILGLALLAALQVDDVATMLGDRARLIQSYDGARLGRFARHALGFQMAMEYPLGIGILQFAGYFGEDPHNVYLKAMLDYSWLGFAAYFMLIISTLALGFRLLFRDRPWRVFLACAWITFFGHALMGNVIDTDHWRHWFLLLGMIWGCIALEARYQRAQ